MKYLIIAISTLFVSCDTVKDLFKHKNESSWREVIETITYRQGDTIHYEVPVYHFHDTTIYRKNEYGTVLKTVYDKSGNVSSVDCFASKFETIQRENREFQNDVKELVKHKEVVQNFDWVIYVMIGLVVIMCFAILLGYFYIKAQTKRII